MAENGGMGCTSDKRTDNGYWERTVVDNKGEVNVSDSLLSLTIPARESTVASLWLRTSPRSRRTCASAQAWTAARAGLGKVWSDRALGMLLDNGPPG